MLGEVHLCYKNPGYNPIVRDQEFLVPWWEGKNLEHLKVNIDYIKGYSEHAQFDLQGQYSCHFSENW